MKPLILILLLAISVQGQIPQSLADAARKERERRAAVGTVTVHVVTTEEARRSAPPDPSAVPAAPAPATAQPKAAATPAQPPVPPKPAEGEALKKYNEDVAKLKARIVQLQDQDTALQLQMNDLKNAALSPVTDSATQDQAKQQLGQAQTQLVDTEKELADTKKELDTLEAQGPPKP